MNLRPPRRDEVEINLISLIDVLLFLVIFFMVSTTFVKKAEIGLTLPEATTKESSEDRNKIEITLDAGGRCYVNGEPLADAQLATIETALAAAAKGLKDPTVVLDADAQATHQAVVTVLDAARRVGLVRVTFGIESSQQPRP